MPPDREPLTRDRVVAAAVDFADRDGVGSLSMRKLARELGVEAMSLYNHVANKADLLDRMVDAVQAEYALPAPGPDWKTNLRAIALSAHATLVRHPWACRMLVTRSGPLLPGQVKYMDSMLETMRRGGFSAELTHHGYHALDFHILGFTLQEVSLGFAAEELEELGAAVLRELSSGDHPYLVEHVEGHLRSEFSERSGFEFGLDLILDGLERIVAAGGSV